MYRPGTLAADSQGYAVNPRTGQRELLWITYEYNEVGGIVQETGWYFQSDGDVPGGLYGAAQPAGPLTYHTDNSGTFDNFLQRAVQGALATLGVVAAGAAVAGQLAAPAAVTTEAATVGITVPADVAAIEAAAVAAPGAPELFEVALAVPVIEVPALAAVDEAAIAAAAGAGGGAAAAAGGAAAGAASTAGAAKAAQSFVEKVAQSAVVQKLIQAVTPRPASPSSVQPRTVAQATPADADNLAWLALGAAVLLLVN